MGRFIFDNLGIGLVLCYGVLLLVSLALYALSESEHVTQGVSDRLRIAAFGLPFIGILALIAIYLVVRSAG